MGVLAALPLGCVPLMYSPISVYTTHHPNTVHPNYLCSFRVVNLLALPLSESWVGRSKIRRLSFLNGPILGS